MTEYLLHAIATAIADLKSGLSLLLATVAIIDFKTPPPLIYWMLHGNNSDVGL